MCIFDREFKKKTRKNKKVRSQKKVYKPRAATIFVGKNDKREPIPSYWSLR
jgi:hypothetical protein